MRSFSAVVEAGASGQWGRGMLLAMVLLLASGEIVWPPHSPRLPVFGPGPVFNLQNNVGLANASAHASSSTLIVTFGERLGGREGMWMTTGGYAALKLLHESCFHDGSGNEVRTDLVSTIGVAVSTAAFFELFNRLGWLHWSKPQAPG